MMMRREVRGRRSSGADENKNMTELVAEVEKGENGT